MCVLRREDLKKIQIEHIKYIYIRYLTAECVSMNVNSMRDNIILKKRNVHDFKVLFKKCVSKNVIYLKNCPSVYDCNEK